MLTEETVIIIVMKTVIKNNVNNIKREVYDEKLGIEKKRIFAGRALRSDFSLVQHEALS